MLTPNAVPGPSLILRDVQSWTGHVQLQDSLFLKKYLPLLAQPLPHVAMRLEKSKRLTIVNALATRQKRTIASVAADKPKHDL